MIVKLLLGRSPQAKPTTQEQCVWYRSFVTIIEDIIKNGRSGYFGTKEGRDNKRAPQCYSVKRGSILLVIQE